MAGSAGQLSVSRNDGDRARVLGIADALDDPIVGGGRKLEGHPGLTAALRILGRARAIEHEPDLSVRIREAPGESDQALSHGVGPEWLLASGTRAKRRAVEGIVTVDEPKARAGEGLEPLGVLIAGIHDVGTAGWYLVRSVRGEPPRGVSGASCAAVYGIGSANPRRADWRENPAGARPTTWVTATWVTATWVTGRVTGSVTVSHRPIRPNRARTARSTPSRRVPQVRPQSPREPRQGSSTPKVVVDAEAFSWPLAPLAPRLLALFGLSVKAKALWQGTLGCLGSLGSLNSPGPSGSLGGRGFDCDEHPVSM